MTHYPFFAYAVCLITSVSSGLGVGGGGIMTLYLSAFAGMKQIYAQGVNLIGFTFALSPSTLINAVKYKPDIRIVTFLTFCGTVGCILGVLLSSYTPDLVLRKCCGVFLAVTGALSLVKTVRSGD